MTFLPISNFFIMTQEVIWHRKLRGSAPVSPAPGVGARWGALVRGALGSAVPRFDSQPLELRAFRVLGARARDAGAVEALAPWRPAR